MNKQSITIFQITDQHLFRDVKTNLLGINPYLSFMATMKLMNTELKRQQPALVIFTGDTSHDGAKQSYQYIVDAIKQITCPITWIPGNHDNPEYAEEIFASSSILKQRSFIFGDWQLILLHSFWHNHIAGKLNAAELEFLNQALESKSAKYVALFVHHHVLPIGCRWLDQHIMSNANQLLSILDCYSSVKAVFCGHVHQDNIKIRYDISFISSPSTSFQFAKEADVFTLDAVMPGYRSIELCADGSINTHVVRVVHDSRFVPDLNNRKY